MSRIDYHELLLNMPRLGLKTWAEKLPTDIAAGLSEQRYGDLPQWKSSLQALPNILSEDNEFKSSVHIGDREKISKEDQQSIELHLKALMPWRKGPYEIFGLEIDTEWRSDWKWDRVLPHLKPLKNKLILDVGCGNGYHCWRMLGEGARRVIGIDPSPRFVVQFYCLKHFVGQAPIDVLPVGIETLPDNLQAFDTIFSMGVFYHRRSPFDHLKELKQALKPGGEVVLETLIINGKAGEVLVPSDRYAMMNNVWFLPSCDTLIDWMKKIGFINPRVVDINQTSLNEQRKTDWMSYHSLEDFLDPRDPNLTVEGYPAPTRAVFIAEAPK